MQAHINVKIAASMARFFIEHDLLRCNTISSLVRTIIETLYDNLKASHKLRPFKTAEEAISYLAANNLARGQIATDGKLTLQLRKHISIDDLALPRAKNSSPFDQPPEKN